MIPSQFDYHKAESVDHALELLAKHGDDAKLLAGGHSLLPAMKLRLNNPGVLIDIRKVAELNSIREENGNIIIGAGVTHNAIATSDLVKEKIAMMAQAGDMIGDMQVRNMGTIGGSIAHADPAADWPAILQAAEASVELKGPKGSRVLTAADFFQGFFETALAEDEIIVAVHVPIPPAHTTSTYHKFVQPASRFAIVGCAVMITRSNGTCERVRVAFSGVSESAFRDTKVEDALTGKEPSAENIAAAAAEAAQDVSIMSDHFAAEDYRKHLATVYAKRALTEAAGS